MTDCALAISDLRYSHDRTAKGFELRVNALEIHRGDDVLIVGKSGEGKSTLLNIAAGLLEPSDGEVRIAGRAIHRLKGAERDRFRAAHIGMVFQTHHLLAGFTALENVMVALSFSDIPSSKHRSIAADLLGLLGIDRSRAMPDALSVGQQQRVAIARALAREPDVVLADEPTASLDPANAEAVIEMMRAACSNRGAALVCVSHDPTMVERFGRVERLSELDERRNRTKGTRVVDH